MVMFIGYVLFFGALQVYCFAYSHYIYAVAPARKDDLKMFIDDCKLL